MAALALLCLVLGAAVAPGSRARPEAPPLLTLGAAQGRALPPSFLGLSLEYWTFAALAGSSPGHVDPLFVQLLRRLSADGPPQLRIGGDSADQTLPAALAAAARPGVRYLVTRTWMETLARVLRATGSSVVLDGDLAAGVPGATAALVREARSVLPPGRLAAVAIGNEPDLYTTLRWYRDTLGRLHPARPRGFGVAQYVREYSAALAEMRDTGIPFRLAGPDLGGTHWLRSAGALVRTDPVSLYTAHLYALSACGRRRWRAGYPTVAALMSDAASHGAASRLAGQLAVARRAGVPLRVEEGNSVSCSGAPGVSDAPVAALWAPDLLFELWRAGAAGMNFHASGGSYDVMRARDTSAGWRARLAPLFTGLQLFEDALGPRPRLLAVAGCRPPHVKVWATRDAGGARRVLILNKGLRAPARLRVRAAGAARALVRTLDAGGRAAPELGGVRAAGWVAAVPPRAPATRALAFRAGSVTVTVPPLGAAVLAIPPSREPSLRATSPPAA
jgi:hypothetical protein